MNKNPMLIKPPAANSKNSTLDEVHTPLLKSAIELLDGSHTWEEIWGKLLVDGYDPQDIGVLLEQLQQEGNIDEERSDMVATNSLQFQQIFLLGQLAAQEGMVANSETSMQVGERLQNLISSSEVVVFGTAQEHLTEFEKVLNQLGIFKIQCSLSLIGEHDPVKQQHDIDVSISSLSDKESALVICVTAGGDRGLSEMVNRRSVAQGIPVIYYHVQGFQVQVGPLVIPKQTGCYECYKVRREAALAPWERSLISSAKGGGQLACTLGADWLAVDTLKFLGKLGEPVSRGRVLFIDYYAGLPEVHSVLRLPRCEICGTARRPAVRLWKES